MWNCRRTCARIRSTPNISTGCFGSNCPRKIDMAESQVIERNPTATVIRTSGNGQQLTIPSLIPILPIRNIVVFPGTVMPLNVGRQKSKNLLDEVMPGDKLIGVVTQKNAEVEDPAYGDLFVTGTACVILKLFKLPDGNQSIIV